MKFKMGGSGIHIKPENKGKFTATKKATGKSTEELTHSKNPVTKKRAIFAQNAAKWKHGDGSKKLATADSTAYYGKQMEKFMKKRSSVSIDKAPPYDEKVNKAMSDMHRQTKKGKPGYDANGHPIMMKMQMGTKSTKSNSFVSKDKMVKELGDPTRVFKKAAGLAKDLYKKPKETLSKLNPLNNVYEDLKTSSTKDKVSKKMCGSKGMKYAEGTKSIKFKKPMIKRADGSTSQRGLWDNIRANKGSGKKPTSEMLKQEKKIKFGK
jgi:hypothetical protein